MKNQDKLGILFDQIQLPDEYRKEFDGGELMRIIGNQGHDVYHFVIQLPHLVKPHTYFTLKEHLHMGFPTFRKTMITLQVPEIAIEPLKDYYRYFMEEYAKEHNVKKNEKEIKEEIGVVLDDSFLSEYLTAKQVNSIMKDFFKTWNENKYINLLKQFNLPTNKLIKDFSSGMKMKLKIATAISHNPKLLILDEPTSGLDPVVRNEILDIFRKYIEEDETRSILLSTHITTDLEHISDYIVFIKQGTITFDLPTNELLENYGIIKCSKEDFIRLDEKDYISYKKGKYQYEVLTNDKSAIRSKYNISTIDKPSIEDIMLFYIKGEK